MFEPRYPSLKVVKLSSTDVASKKTVQKNMVKRVCDSEHNAEAPRREDRPHRPAAFELPHSVIYTHRQNPTPRIHNVSDAICVRMILPQVHLRKPCYDFSFL